MDSLDLLIDGEQGLWHLANRGAVSWLELARQVAELAGRDTALIEGSSSAAGLVAPRPHYSVLGSERGMLLPSLDDALSRYLHECVADVSFFLSASVQSISSQIRSSGKDDGKEK